MEVLFFILVGLIITLNATQLCSLALTSGGVPKRYPDWKRLPNTATFINEFVESMYYGIFKEKNALFLQKLLTSIDTEENQGKSQGILPVVKSTGGNNEDNGGQNQHLARYISNVEMIVNGKRYEANMVKLRIEKVAFSYEDRGVNDRGTWVHIRIAINIAEWCSPRFAAQMTDWAEDLFLYGHVELKNSEIRAIQQDFGNRIEHLKDELDDAKDKLITLGAKSAETATELSRANGKMVQVIDRVVPRVPVQFRESVGIMQLDEHNYEAFHRQDISKEGAKKKGTLIGEEYAVPSGGAIITNLRNSSSPKIFNPETRTWEVPEDAFFMRYKQIETGKNYTKEQLIEHLEQLVEEAREEFRLQNQ